MGTTTRRANCADPTGRWVATAFDVAPVGLGETLAIADNDTTDGRATNRRVELIIVEQDSTGCAE